MTTDAEPHNHSFHRDAQIRDERRKPQKAAEALAQRIEAEIIAADWPVGRRLGSEPELISKYGVSRMVLREAIRILEHHMTAFMRRGPGGGLMVTAPDPSMVTEAAALYLDFKRAAPQHLYNTRRALEVTCVELVTASLDAAGEVLLRGLVEDEAGFGLPEVVERSDAFHRGLAELSGDPALGLFIGVLTRLTSELAPPMVEILEVESAQVFQGRADHIAIAEAVLKRDATSASKLMQAHLEWITAGMVNPRPQ